ncbi:MAG TPA: hypothetical protein VI320_05120 [Terracidiphilus sp.]|jgi:hypothetical protein
MRPVTFSSATLKQFLLRHKVAALPDLKRALGTSTELTVFRKLKQLHYLSSYTHRGSFYTLPGIAHFDANGLWSFHDVWFSRHGTLLATAEAFVRQSPRGYFADELAAALHTEVQDPLRILMQRRLLHRSELAGLYLYTSPEPTIRRQQILARQAAQLVPGLADPSILQCSAEELQAAIVLFHGLLDEQQRRLYAGLESLRLGRGGDSRLAALLGLDVHTVARGRHQLLEQQALSGRVRQPGAGRKPTEKKPPES